MRTKVRSRRTLEVDSDLPRPYGGEKVTNRERMSRKFQSKYEIDGTWKGDENIQA